MATPVSMMLIWRADFFLHVRTVGDHDAHSQRHGVKQLSHSTEEGRRRELREIWYEILCRSIHGTGQSEHVDGDYDDKDQEYGHQDLAHLLNSLVDSDVDHEHGQESEKEEPEKWIPEDASEFAADELPEESGLRDLVEPAGSRFEKILGYPSADDAVVRNDYDGDQCGYPADEPMLMGQVFECFYARFPGAPSQGELGDQKRESEDDCQDDVDE